MYSGNENLDQRSQDIRDRIVSVIGQKQFIFPLHEPEFSDLEEKLTLDCIRSGWVSYLGKYVKKFEEELAQFCGVKHAIAVVNGTAALKVALQIVGIKPKDEVIMPSLTFIASASAAHQLAAIPHFVDIELESLGMDPVLLEKYLSQILFLKDGVNYNKETGRRISAIVPTHVFGHCPQISALVEIGNKFGIPVVEDAAEALGSVYNGKHSGSFGQVGVLSFNGNKIITTGGGGAILTDDKNLAQKALHLTTTAKIPHPWEFIHDAIAYNYRLPNLNAAIGVAQLGKLKERVYQKRILAKLYQKAFSDCPYADFMVEPSNCLSNYWLNTLILKKGAFEKRDTILEELNKTGLSVRPVWKPLHKQQIFDHCPRGHLPITDFVSKRIINIPSSAKLGQE